MTTAPVSIELEREAQRQQRLLRALQGEPTALDGWLRSTTTRRPRALQAYRAHAGAAAERALSAAFPTVRQLVGDDAFAALARSLWHRSPPDRGDLAEWGAMLPAFTESDPALADVPYLGDVARVDWAVHRAESAADAGVTLAGLTRLAEDDPAALQLVLAPGAMLFDSAYPVVTIWTAHRSPAPDRFAPVREAFARGQGEMAFVWRDGWRGQVAAVDAPDQAFMRALCEGVSIDAALDRAAPDFVFELWLQRALGAHWLVGVETHPAAVSPDGGIRRP